MRVLDYQYWSAGVIFVVICGHKGTVILYIIYTKTAKLWKSVQPQNARVKKKSEIKGSNQEMAVIIV